MCFVQSRVFVALRRFIVDVDMGTVVGLANFGDENGWPDSHIFRLENGKVRFVHTLTVCPDGCELPTSLRPLMYSFPGTVVK